MINNSLGDISTIGNETYNSFEKLLRYYIDNNFLPDVNMSPLIPIMTSNTTPSGEVIFGGIHPSYSGQEFKAFDDNDTTKFFDADGANGAYVGYKFEKPVCAKLFSLLFERIPQEFSIEASNDGNTWVPLVRKANNSNNKFEKETLNNNNEYLYYRYKKIVGDKTWGSSYLLSFQLYGRKNF